MPPENNTEIRIDNTLLTQTNDALAVGFKNEESLYFLKKILVELFDKEHKLEDKDKEEIQRGLRSVTDAVNNQTKKEESSNEKLAKQLMKVTDEEKRKWKVAEAYLKTAADVSIRALNIYMKNTQELTSLFRNLDKNGILVKDGFDSLGDSAYNLGMTYDELANNLTKLSPIVAKLNGSMGNGVKIFEKSLMAIPKSLSLSHDEQVSAFQMATDGLTASHMKSINSEEELIKRVVDTAKEMKLLKVVTGKSIEAIKEENNARMKDARFKQFESRFGSDTMATLKSVFKNDNAIEWLLTGGTAHAGEMATLMANSPGLQKALPEIMQLVQSGNLTTESMIGVISKYQNQLTQKGAMARNFAGQAGHMAAAGLSSNYQNIAFNTDIEDSMLSLVKNPQEIMNSESYLKDQRLLNNSQGYMENLNRIDVTKKDLTTGGVEGMANAYGVGEKVLGWTSTAIKSVDTVLKNLELSGTTTALLSSAVGSALPNVGSWMLGKAWNGIKKVFGAKTMEDNVKNIDKNVDKLANGKSGGVNPDAVTDGLLNKIFKSNIMRRILSKALPFLKSATPLIAKLAVASAVAYTSYKSGELIGTGIQKLVTMNDNYKQNLEESQVRSQELAYQSNYYGLRPHETAQLRDMSADDRMKVLRIREKYNLSFGESVQKMQQEKREQQSSAMEMVKKYTSIQTPYEQSLINYDKPNNKDVCERLDTLISVMEKSNDKTMKQYTYDKLMRPVHPVTTVPQPSY